MRKLLTIVLILSGSYCDPYHPYYFTHYHITASYDPASNSLSANVQMVFVPEKAYHDSITFRLNESVEIQSLAAQELKYYEFKGGRLVLFIEEAVRPGDQLHISMTYKGLIGDFSERGQVLSPESLWYPVDPGIDKLTYSIGLDLPEHYNMEKPGIRKGKSWHWGMEKPVVSIAVPRIWE
jgi:hypothetical protein